MSQEKSVFENSGIPLHWPEKGGKPTRTMPPWLRGFFVQPSVQSVADKFSSFVTDLPALPSPGEDDGPRESELRIRETLTAHDREGSGPPAPGQDRRSQSKDFTQEDSLENKLGKARLPHEISREKPETIGAGSAGVMSLPQTPVGAAEAPPSILSEVSRGGPRDPGFPAGKGRETPEAGRKQTAENAPAVTSPRGPAMAAVRKLERVPGPAARFRISAEPARPHALSGVRSVEPGAAQATTAPVAQLGFPNPTAARSSDTGTPGETEGGRSPTPEVSFGQEFSLRSAWQLPPAVVAAGSPEGRAAPESVLERLNQPAVRGARGPARRIQIGTLHVTVERPAAAPAQASVFTQDAPDQTGESRSRTVINPWDRYDTIFD